MFCKFSSCGNILLIRPAEASFSFLFDFSFYQYLYSTGSRSLDQRKKAGVKFNVDLISLN